MAIVGKERYVVFGVGVVLGILLIGYIQQRRFEADPSGDSMVKKVFRDSIASTGIEPLPPDTHPALRESRLYSFDKLPSPNRPELRKIWMLEMLEGPWPWVRVESFALPDAQIGDPAAKPTSVCVADRILVRLKAGAPIDALETLAVQKGFSLGKFYKAESAHVVHIDDFSPLAIPVAIGFFMRATDLVETAKPHPAPYY